MPRGAGAPARPRRFWPAVPGAPLPVSTALALAAQLAAVAAVAGPWLRLDQRWRDVADAPIHLVRIYVVSDALARGDWYPRWLPDMYLGYGYPLLTFYAPGAYYLGAALHGLGMTVYRSLQWSGVLAVAGGALGAYVLSISLYGRRQHAGALAAAVFVLAPYPFITNLSLRAAVPEALALGLLPWLLLAAWGAWRWGGWWTPALAAAIAAMLLTHNVSSLLALGLLAAWLVALNLLDRDGVGRGAAAGRTGAAIVAGAGLSAFFWLPALAEAGLVQLEAARGAFQDPRTWLFDPLAAAGAVAHPEYPHTRFGPADLSLVFDYAALSQWAPEKASLGQALIWLAGALSCAHAAWRGRGGAAKLPALWLGLAAVCWLANTTWSLPIWNAVPPARLVQFPWRIYGELALCLGLAAGGSLALAPPGRARLAARGIATGLVALLTFGSLAARPFLAGPPPAHDVDQQTVAAEEYNRYGAGTTSGGEFLPRTVLWDDDRPPHLKRGIRLYDDAYPQAGWQAGLVRVLDGRAAIDGVYRAPNWLAADVVAETPAQVAFHQLAFPGWRAFVDGRPAAAAPVAYHERVRAWLGFAVVDVSAGAHRVELRFGPTPARLLGATLSAVSLALVAAWLAWRALPGAARRSLRRSPRLPLVAAALAVWAAGAAGCAAAVADRETRPMGRIPRDADRVVLDVTGAVARSGADTQAPHGTGRGVLPPFLDVQYVRISDEQRRWLYMHPPAQVVVAARVPARAFFQAGLALDPRAWDADAGDGVRFILEADGPSGRRTLLDRHVNPRARAEDRGWLDQWVDLSGLAGQQVRLTLRTDVGQDASYDWAGWSNPQIVVWDAARPHPGSPHPW